MRGDWGFRILDLGLRIYEAWGIVQRAKDIRRGAEDRGHRVYMWFQVSGVRCQADG